jgi:patatin-like phospholipase/acyl hydrolase
VHFLILQARLDPLENAPLKLVCQATAAAPTYLPPVHFKLTNSTTDASREFNLIDGGVAVNNPVTCGFWSFILVYFVFFWGGVFLELRLITSSHQDRQTLSAPATFWP